MTLESGRNTVSKNKVKVVDYGDSDHCTLTQAHLWTHTQITHTQYDIEHEHSVGHQDSSNYDLKLSKVSLVQKFNDKLMNHCPHSRSFPRLASIRIKFKASLIRSIIFNDFFAKFLKLIKS